MDVDCEVLIELVFAKPSLWDKRHKLHSNRNVTDKHWKEISLEMKHDENKLRKKWRYLRDQFAVEFGKIPPSRSGDEAISEYPKWPYFKSLLFLKDVVKPRLSTGNLTRPRSISPANTDQDETSNIETTHYDELTLSPLPLCQEKDVNESGHSTSSVKRAKKSYNDKILEIEEQKLNLLRAKDKYRALRSSLKEEDENDLFFKSLLPHVKRIPQHTLLSFRNRIQSVVKVFAYRSHSSYNNSPYTSRSNYRNLSHNSTPEPYHQSIVVEQIGDNAPESGTSQTLAEVDLNNSVVHKSTPSTQDEHSLADFFNTYEV